MSWSKVNHKYSKPLKWWYHKILCELGYWIYEQNENEKTMLFGQKKYHYHLNKLCDYGFNLYGEKIKL